MVNLSRKQESMGPIGRWDPFRLMREMMGRDFPEFGSLLEHIPSRDIEGLGGQRVFMPDFEVREGRDQYTVCADLPGLRDEDVQVAVEGNRLTVSGRREEERRDEGEQRYVYERSYGSFSRSFVLPETADVEGIQADLKEGVLRIEIPKKAGVSARRIPVGGKATGELGGKQGKEEEKGLIGRGVEKGREVIEKGKEMMGREEKEQKESKGQKAA